MPEFVTQDTGGHHGVSRASYLRKASQDTRARQVLIIVAVKLLQATCAVLEHSTPFQLLTALLRPATIPSA